MSVYLENPQLEQEKQHAKKEQILSILFLIALLVFLPLFSPGEDTDNLLVWKNQTMIITMPNDQVYAVPYDTIEELTLLESPDFGVCVSGEKGKDIWWGSWENRSVGSYVLCTYRSFDTVIQVQTQSKVFWIGYESPETTRILYQSFMEHWRQ